MHQFLLLNKKINLEKLSLNLLYRKSHYKNRLVIISENKVEKLIEKINFTINNLITKNNDTFVKDEKIFFSSEVGNKALEEKDGYEIKSQALEVKERLDLVSFALGKKIHMGEVQKESLNKVRNRIIETMGN